MQYLTIWDLLLTPLYLLVIIRIAKGYRDKNYPRKHPLRKYFLNGLYVKLAGAIFIGLVYQYYYGGGDTFQYFLHSKVINSALSDSFETWYHVITRTSISDFPGVYPYATQMEWYGDPASFSIAAFAAFIGLFNGTSYMPIAVTFAAISYTGIWAMFRIFASIYHAFHKEMAIAFLFIPSTFVWGSSIFKDTVCMFALGWLTYTVFRIFIYKDFSVKNIVMLFLGLFLLFKIKLYILMAFLPALSIWLLTTYSARIKSLGTRYLVRFIFISGTTASFFIFAQIFAKDLNKYSLENIAETATVTRDWLTYMSAIDQGSGYDLGEFDPSLTGMIKKFPQAVVVTLFRPFPWEARKVIVFLSALEALGFVLLTFYAFKKAGLFKSFKLINKDPNLLFCLIFSVIFAFAVGISTYNFGALSRYKIPCLPFYAAFLIILINYEKINPAAFIKQKKGTKKLFREPEHYIAE